MDFLVILLSTVLVNNFVLTRLLGLCPFAGASNKLQTAVGMSAATTILLTLTSICSYLIHSWILIPLGLEFLHLLAFVLIMAALVQSAGLFIEKLNPEFIEKLNPGFYRELRAFAPLIAANSAMLGIALLSTDKPQSLAQSAFYGLSAALGFSLTLVLFTVLSERLVAADVPRPFKGAAIGMISAGLVSLAFMGLAGLV